MTYARTIAAVAVATITLALAPQVYEVADADTTVEHGAIEHVALETVEIRVQGLSLLEGFRLARSELLSQSAQSSVHAGGVSKVPGKPSPDLKNASEERNGDGSRDGYCRSGEDEREHALEYPEARNRDG